MDALLGCPFCGGQPKAPFQLCKSGSGSTWEISCARYCCFVTSQTKKGVIAFWNRRDEALITAHVADKTKELREALEKCQSVFQGMDAISWEDESAWQHSDYCDVADEVEDLLNRTEAALAKEGKG